MLYALVQPAALAGLVVAFCLAFLLRRLVHHLAARSAREFAQPRERFFVARRDIDPVGVAGAALAGVGWGKAPPEALHRRPWLVLAAPAVVLLAAQAVFAAYLAAGLDDLPLRIYAASDVLRGVPGPVTEQVVLSIAVGMLAFGLLDLIPLPPLSGWYALVGFAKRPEVSYQRARHWLEDNNGGLVILIVAAIIPAINGAPLLLFVLDLVATPVLRAWA